MTKKETVQVLQQGFITNIKSILQVKQIESLQFKTPFRIWVTEDMYDEESRVPYSGLGLLSDGTVVGGSEIDEQEFPLETLDIYEIAHILDLLENLEYIVLETI